MVWYNPHMDTLPSLSRPGPADCHLWILGFDHLESRRDQLESTLSTGERHRVQAYLRDADRDRFELGRGALRVLLGAYSRIEAQEVVIQIDERGRPYQPAGRGPAFSMAHSGEMLVLAFSGTAAIGVDVEQVRPVKGWPGVLDSVLHPAEKAALQFIGSHDQRTRFFRHWTLKEALSKAAGMGLEVPFPGVYIEIDRDSARLVAVPEMLGRASDWWVQPVTVASGYHAALAGIRPEAVLTRFDAGAFEPILGG